MENIIQFFENLESYQRTLILIGGICFFWIFEGIFPYFKMDNNKGRHALINIFFTITAALINLVFAFLIVMACDFTAANNFGIIHMFAMPVWLQVIIAILIMDFIGAYLIHYIQHKTPVLWRFHIVHHTDQNVDATTALRHHPIENIFRVTFTLLAVLVSGAPIGLFILYQTLSAFFSQFEHANIRIPNKLDRILSWVFITPAIHKVHHHYKMPYTDTNFGNIFSIWDHLFGTFSRMDESKLTYGVDTHMEHKDHASILHMLAIPFRKKK